MNTSRHGTTCHSQHRSRRESEAMADIPDGMEHCLGLEGERKITDYYFLELSLAKIVMLGLPLVLSVVGLYFLLKSTTLRARVLYSHHRTFIPSVTTDALVIVND